MTEPSHARFWVGLSLALMLLALALWAGGPYPDGGYPDWSQPYADAP